MLLSTPASVVQRTYPDGRVYQGKRVSSKLLFFSSKRNIERARLCGAAHLSQSAKSLKRGRGGTPVAQLESH